MISVTEHGATRVPALDRPEARNAIDVPTRERLLAELRRAMDDPAVRAIVATVRAFVDKEILPVATELEHADAYPQAIVDGMKELGLFGLMIGEEHGGLGESLLTYALAVEELARGWMSVSGIVNTHFIVAWMIIYHGTPEQKAHYLPKMATGEIRGAFSMSEPGCGSDVSAIRTRAVPDGDSHVIDGQKMWLTNGASANLVATLVKTDPDAGHRGMTGGRVRCRAPG